MPDLKAMYKTVMDDHFPEEMTISLGDQKLIYRKRTWKIADADGSLVEKGLRYGENPGQEAALYELAGGNLQLGDCRFIAPGRGLPSRISEEEMLQFGKHPGKTNLTDADNALNILRYLTEKPTAVIVKHNNPCGVAQADALSDAYQRAYMADRVAAFGGCIALNRAVDRVTAEAISAQYAEVVVAPEFEEGVLSILARRKNLRVIRIDNIHRLETFAGQRVVDFKSLIDGGQIVQWSFVPETRTQTDLALAECEYQGETYHIRREPTDAEYADLLFGWLVEAGVTSNSVLYVKDLATVGIGTGEQDRVGVAEIARDKAYRKLADRYCFEAHGTAYTDLTDADRKAEIDERVRQENGGLVGASMVSDAFFPFRDGVDVGIRERISAVIQPGGSANDYQSINACNEAGVTMVFTGQRSFKH